MLEQTSPMRHYAAGVRVSELISLTVKDIDSARMVIHVRQGKERKDRYVVKNPHSTMRWH